MEYSSLTWVLIGLLGVGLATALANLSRRRAPLVSAIFGLLLAGGLWAVLGLPAATVPFTVLGVGALGCATAMILSRSPALAASWMLGVFFCLAAVYLLLGFPFLAMVQVMVYAGAVTVLFLFVVMLLDLSGSGEAAPDPRTGPIGPVLAGVLGAVLITVFAALGSGAIAGGLSETELIAKAERVGPLVNAGGGFAAKLFKEYLLPFEAVTMLLLAALVGVIILARGPQTNNSGSAGREG